MIRLALVFILVNRTSWAAPSTCEHVLGFHPEVVSAGDFSAHTMADPMLYAQKQLGAEVMRHIRRGHRFTVLLGTVDEAKRQMAASGFIVLRELQKDEGFHRVFEIQYPNGDLGVVGLRVNTDDRLVHIHALAKIVGADTSQIVTIGKVHSWYEDWRVLVSRNPSDLVVYGMPNTALDSLLHSSPDLYPKIGELYEKRRAPVELFQHELSNMHVAVLTTVYGQRIWFVPNLYGEMAKDFMRAVNENGFTPTIFLGSCGAISDRMRVRDWVIPNDSRTSAKLFPELLLSRHGRVPTFLIETQTWLARSRAVCDTVDVEYGYAAQVFGAQGSLYPLLVVTDVLAGSHARDISSWTYADQKSLSAPIERFLRGVMAKLGLKSKFTGLTTLLLAPSLSR